MAWASVDVWWVGCRLLCPLVVGRVQQLWAAGGQLVAAAAAAGELPAAGHPQPSFKC